MMMAIVVMYSCILGYEWFYLKRKKRKVRTYVFVLGTALLLFLGSEALYIFKERLPLVKLIEGVFGPIEKYIVPMGANHG